MLILAVTLTVLSCLVCLVWFTRHLMIQRENRKGFILTPAHPGPPQDAPKVSVVVAAKDEAENIEVCIRTLLQQDYPNFEVVVCNDRSVDDTPGIVQRVAASDARCRLVNITHLPQGWCGKNNAMQTGITQTNGEWVVMIDADCRQISPRTLSAAVQHAKDTATDMLSVLPVLEMKGFWENVVQPVCGGVMMIWFHPDKVNDPAKPNAYANGAFMMIRRSTYEAIGRHENVKDRMNEDMHMADLVKRSGFKLRVVRSRDLFICRMYTSLGAILRGWSRIFYGTFVTLRRLVISLVVMTVMGPLPYALGALGLAMGSAGAAPQGAWWACGAAGAAAALMQLSVIYRYFHLASGRRWLAWTYPLGCIVTIIALVQGILKLRRGAKVVWRSTSYATK